MDDGVHFLIPYIPIFITHLIAGMFYYVWFTVPLIVFIVGAWFGLNKCLVKQWTGYDQFDDEMIDKYEVNPWTDENLVRNLCHLILWATSCFFIIILMEQMFYSYEDVMYIDAFVAPYNERSTEKYFANIYSEFDTFLRFINNLFA